MGEKQVLVIDVGNTQTVFGLFQGSRLKSDWRINSDREKGIEAYAGNIETACLAAGTALNDLSGVVISSVVPLLQDIFKAFCQTRLNLSPIIVNETINTGLAVKVDAPEEVGADRIVNTLAAYRLMKQACIVVDFGTATTFDCVSSKGEFLGGVIMPGIGISAEALFQATSKLPRVEIARPESFIGKRVRKHWQKGCISHNAFVEVYGSDEPSPIKIRQQTNSK